MPGEKPADDTIRVTQFVCHQTTQTTPLATLPLRMRMLDAYGRPELAIVLSLAEARQEGAIADALAAAGAMPRRVRGQELDLERHTESFDAALLDLVCLADLPRPLRLPLLRSATQPILLGDAHRTHDALPFQLIQLDAPAEEIAAKLLFAASIGRQRSLIANQSRRFNRRFAGLSAKEQAVMEGLIEGRMNKQLAREQDVSVRTIEQRRRRVYEAFEVQSPARLSFAAGVVHSAGAFLGGAQDL